jgi:hypothetical protein
MATRSTEPVPIKLRIPVSIESEDDASLVFMPAQCGVCVGLILEASPDAAPIKITVSLPDALMLISAMTAHISRIAPRAHDESAD